MNQKKKKKMMKKKKMKKMKKAIHVWVGALLVLTITQTSPIIPMKVVQIAVTITAKLPQPTLQLFQSRWEPPGSSPPSPKHGQHCSTTWRCHGSSSVQSERWCTPKSCNRQLHETFPVSDTHTHSHTFPVSDTHTPTHTDIHTSTQKCTHHKHVHAQSNI